MKIEKEVFNQILPHELGACMACPKYCDDRAHERTSYGVRIKCMSVLGLTLARTDIKSPEECELFNQEVYINKNKK